MHMPIQSTTSKSHTRQPLGKERVENVRERRRNVSDRQKRSGGIWQLMRAQPLLRRNWADVEFVLENHWKQRSVGSATEGVLCGCVHLAIKSHRDVDTQARARSTQQWEASAARMKSNNGWIYATALWRQYAKWHRQATFMKNKQRLSDCTSFLLGVLKGRTAMKQPTQPRKENHFLESKEHKNSVATHTCTVSGKFQHNG